MKKLRMIAIGLLLLPCMLMVDLSFAQISRMATREEAGEREKDPIGYAIALPKDMVFEKLSKDQQENFKIVKDEYTPKLRAALDKLAARGELAKISWVHDDKSFRVEFNRISAEAMHEIRVIVDPTQAIRPRVVSILTDATRTTRTQKLGILGDTRRDWKDKNGDALFKYAKLDSIKIPYQLRQIDVVFAKPFRQSRHLQEVTQRFIRPRNPQFDTTSLQLCIQILQRFRRRRIEIADGFRVENDTLQSRTGAGDQFFQALGKKRRVGKHQRRIETIDDQARLGQHRLFVGDAAIHGAAGRIHIVQQRIVRPRNTIKNHTGVFKVS